MDSLDSLFQWISSPVQGDEKNMAPAPYFRKEIWLDRAPTKATLQITAQASIRAQINGQRIGDRALAPGWTDYATRVPLQSYDVASLLKPGKT